MITLLIYLFIAIIVLIIIWYLLKMLPAPMQGFVIPIFLFFVLIAILILVNSGAIPGVHTHIS